MPDLPQPLCAVVMAGRGGDDDPLAAQTGQPHKALLRLHGRPMVSYVLEALRASGCVKHIYLVGVDSQALGETPSPDITHVPDAGGLLENLLAGIAAVEGHGMVLTCGADVPLLTPGAVQDLVARCAQSPADLYYPIVSESAMERRFPGSGRSFRQFVEGRYCGGDLTVVAPEVVVRNTTFLREMSSNRKTAWGMVKLMGLGVILRFLTKRLRISDLEKRGQAILGARVKAVITPCAELAMDVDNPHHLEILLKALDERSAT